MLLDIFRNGVEHSRKDALDAGVSQAEWEQFMVYAASVFNNCGNYKSFGDTKFVPQIAPERFEVIIRSNQHYKVESSRADRVWAAIKTLIYAEDVPF